MDNSEQKPKQTDVWLGVIRAVVLGQAIVFMVSAYIWYISGDSDKWFTRWSIALILLSLWGIMRHLSRNNQ